MYLKSLSLKGFKSFADRTVLELEPGITAVVGPNGSGKSNISDAVLWVLGERNAHHLRGQTMEDIIFSGSSARRPVSVAEVELVLDNSDGTLPVEFNEVSITRRMYRSGESEYLINGVVSRRLDVLDILHDSGLGTGTHSIISQGNLDSVLQSKPADLRSFIEEAAGVLKHKQRKEKAGRKLDALDNHLARVRDVTAEVERQLAPLERKAKRAQAYERVSAEYAEVKRALAVDDLRRLQKQWDEVCASEAQLASDVDERRAVVTSTEQRMTEVQEVMRKATEGAGALARSQRRATAVSERLDAAELLIRERRRSAQDYIAETSSAIESAAARRAQAVREQEDAQRQYDEVQASHAQAKAEVERLTSEYNAAVVARNAASKKSDELDAAMRSAERERTEAQREQEALKENLSAGMAHERLVAARKEEMESTLEHARAECEELRATKAQAHEQLDALTAQEREAQSALGVAYQTAENARSHASGMLDELRAIDAQIQAIGQVQRERRSQVPALDWLMSNSEKFGGAFDEISQVIKVPQGMERLVENLLGADLEALVVRDEKAALDIASALHEAAKAGDVTLLPRTAQAAKHAADSPGASLIDELTYPAEAASAIEALLGDVVVCDTREAAFTAHDRDTSHRRFLSRDGLLVWPSGKVSVFGAASSDDEGALALERRLEDLKKRHDGTEKAQEQADAQTEEAERAYREAQEAALALSQQLASQKGAVQSADAEADRAEKRLASLVDEFENIERQMERARKDVEEVRPAVEDVAARIAALDEKRTNLTREHEEAVAAIEPLRTQASQFSESLSAAKLSEATLAERATYAYRMVDSRKREVDNIDAQAASSKRACAEKRVVIARAEPLLDTIEQLALNLRRRAEALDRAVGLAEEQSSSSHQTIAAVRDEARQARDAFDEASRRVSEVRVEKGRLEVQVEAAVRAVVEDCNTPIDQANQLPPLENRQEAEDTAFKLQRRIKNMGTINPDAAQEYAELKERYDYLAAQLTDLEQARTSLARITRIIDARMKDDFVHAFDEVNRNFGEIFSILFPGGSAELLLEDPDDLEHTGVEVTAQPRGKRIKKMMLMSGGEKSLTALALLFAVYRTRATPFYILDEVEAALDDTNLRRLLSYIQTLRNDTQIIMITHQRRTMEMADVLFGVSMQADGVTKVVSQKLEHALKQAE